MSELKAKQDTRVRTVIESVKPEIDGGRFPVKRIVGDEVCVEADILSDGHDLLSALLLYRKEGDEKWREIPMEPWGNDRWRASFVVSDIGRYRYTIMTWADKFKTWCDGLNKKVQAGHDISVEFLIGAQMVAETLQQASDDDAERMRWWVNALRSEETPHEDKVRLALSDDLSNTMARYSDRRFAGVYPRELVVVVDRQKARFSAWYEMYPRSCALQPGHHGTFKDCEARLPYVAAMGFDVLYFPPIHPIGRINRKGKNNTTVAGPKDPGSPWAIGAEEGGHKSLHPELGTIKDLRRLITKAKKLGLEVAMDIAFHCAPDHPYVKKHPEWFHHLPDGTVQCAENPPNSYDDIYPFNFESEDAAALWAELKSVFDFWISEGLRIFRVDNPHTKPFRFWEWVISEVKREHPDVIFLAEAFTRPKIMNYMSKLGFSQSYTYFAWRHNKWELIEYFTELTRTQVSEYFRSNLWTNTPDNITGCLQYGGRTAFMSRYALAATLGSNCGIYGPAFELCENGVREQGSEEYLNSESYELKHWDIDRPDSIKDFIALVNRARKENPALQNNWSLCFHNVHNDHLLCYSKRTQNYSNIVLMVVNLDPYHTQAGWLDLSLSELGLSQDATYWVHDLLTNARHEWRGSRNYVEVNPHIFPAHIFRIR